ncbi:putative glutathione s-transferase protein [Phaeoacremonium minimum UCRPA7]|uniref:Putative glutathione s-transferase protein n=1 Tax=Phaeoacremonium minimum (strain UCR-PA7) TaxID=1286976 RepID=R8BTJ3_PHAM7|nr:putative glutathione s-transferase protein [Phaeoacremonium minimum UCRPA7]EOO02595.1 putative glutathione s-transferase protein [Phaeoacremonium minimum UCRPA7]
MGYTLFVANKNYSSWSMRPWVLMRAFDIPFEEKVYMFEQTEVQEAFSDFSPSGKVPCLHDSSVGKKGLAVWDSLAIIEYLAEREPEKGIWPTEVVSRSFARCAAAEMHSGFNAIRNEMGMNVGIRVELGEPSKALKRDLERLDALWTEGLTKFGGPWLAGDKFSAADAFFAPVATRLQTYGVNLSELSMTYAKKLLEMPASREWIEAGTQETWRDPGHDEEALMGGRKLLADYRKKA